MMIVERKACMCVCQCQRVNSQQSNVMGVMVMTAVRAL